MNPSSAASSPACSSFRPASSKAPARLPVGGQVDHESACRPLFDFLQRGRLGIQPGPTPRAEEVGPRHGFDHRMAQPRRRLESVGERPRRLGPMATGRQHPSLIKSQSVFQLIHLDFRGHSPGLLELLGRARRIESRQVGLEQKLTHPYPIVAPHRRFALAQARFQQTDSSADTTEREVAARLVLQAQEPHERPADLFGHRLHMEKALDRVLPVSAFRCQRPQIEEDPSLQPSIPDFLDQRESLLVGWLGRFAIVSQVVQDVTDIYVALRLAKRVCRVVNSQFNAGSEGSICRLLTGGTQISECATVQDGTNSSSCTLTPAIPTDITVLVTVEKNAGGGVYNAESAPFGMGPANPARGEANKQTCFELNPRCGAPGELPVGGIPHARG